MAWNRLCIMVDASAMDPGIVHSSRYPTEFARADLREGMKLRYDDPGGVLASLTLKDMDDNGVTLQVGIYDERLDVGQWHRLDTGGRDYTNFELYAKLE